MLSHVQLFVTPWTIALQASLSMGILQARILERVAMPSSRRLFLNMSTKIFSPDFSKYSFTVRPRQCKFLILNNQTLASSLLMCLFPPLLTRESKTVRGQQRIPGRESTLVTISQYHVLYKEGVLITEAAEDEMSHMRQWTSQYKRYLRQCGWSWR